MHNEIYDKKKKTLSICRESSRFEIVDQALKKGRL